MLNSLSLQLPHLPQLGQVTAPNSESATTKPANGLFSQMLLNAVGNVASQQAHAEMLVEDHLLGRPVTDVEVFTAMKQAELTMKTMLQVRNKTVEAYQELKQIQV